MPKCWQSAIYHLHIWSKRNLSLESAWKDMRHHEQGGNCKFCSMSAQVKGSCGLCKISVVTLFSYQIDLTCEPCTFDRHEHLQVSANLGRAATADCPTALAPRFVGRASLQYVWAHDKSYIPLQGNFSGRRVLKIVTRRNNAVNITFRQKFTELFFFFFFYLRQEKWRNNYLINE